MSSYAETVLITSNRADATQNTNIGRRQVLKSLPGAVFLSASVAARAQGAGILQPGRRFVWFGGSATLAGDQSQIEPDPNGGWINRQTGERYSDVPAAGSGGTAFNVIDVMSITNSQVILHQSSYLQHPDSGGVVTFTGSNGVVGNMAGVEDYWVPPERLAGLVEQMAPANRVFRLPYQTAGTTFSAIAIQTNSGAGWSHYVYDIESGICLSFGSTTHGQSVLTRGPGDVISPGEGNTMTVFSRFMGTRATSLPGPGEVFPPELGSVRQILYQGYRSTFLPGSQPYQLPLQFHYELLGPPAAFIPARSMLSDQAAPQDRIVLPGIISSIWMNPAFLARLAENTVIDEDPITRVQALSIGRNGKLAHVALRSALAQETYAYDTDSGFLMQMELREQVAVATMVMTLQFVGMR